MTWRGEYSPGIAGWREALDEAITANDVERTPHRLAEICLTADPMLTTPTHHPRIGLPENLPHKRTVRTAATALSRWVEEHPDRPEAPAWQVIGLLQRLRYQRLVDHEAEGSVVANHQEALQISRTIGDPDLELLCLLRLSKSQRDDNMDAPALETATTALSLLARLGPGTAEPPPVLSAVTGQARWLISQADTRDLFSYRAHQRARIAARMLRDYDRAITEADLAIAAAEHINDRWHVLYAAALAERAAFARALGDVETSIVLLDRQGEYAAETQELGVQRQRLQSLYHNAQFLDDWAAARAHRLDLVRLRMSEVAPPGTEPSPENVAHGIEAYHAAGRRAQVTNFGNDAYELAYNLIESGRARLVPAARVEARAWLDVAAHAWSEIAGSGQIALDFRRLELDALEGVAGDPVVVGRRMVECSRKWRRAPGRRRATLEAVRWGAPGDGVVLDRLVELRADAPPVDAAYLDLGIAHWYLKTGDDQAARGETPAAVGSWREAVRLAAAAAAGLKVDRPTGPPILLNPRYYIESLQVHAGALRRLRDAGHITGATEVDELGVRVASLPAVAQRLTASASPSQRATVDRLYAEWLTETAELAAVVGDHHAADVVAEVARRDLVGTVLYALTTEPDTPERIADLARRIITTLNVKITDTADTEASGEGTPSSEEDRGPDAGTRGARVVDQLTDALDVVGEVLGPVAKTLFDPRTVLETSGSATLAALHPDGSPGAVLSLWLLPTGEKPRLLRRLTWRTTDSEEIHEHVDVVSVPSWLPGYDIGNNPARFFGRLDALTAYLLPPPLLDLLHAADPDNPVNLTVIPTGLLVVPFAALPITPTHRLVDLAVVATAQSLRALTSLTQGRTPDDDLLEPLDVGIYDTSTLEHAQTEWDELRKHRPGVKRLTTLDEADRTLINSAARLGVFALAVHGVPGRDGWSQVKQLPSGETLTTGHVLRWYLPRLVVGASCDTDIRADAGGELGGFPLAFQLRGATTIIGTLYRVDDEATAQIMGLFYAATTAGHSPAAALRNAQRTWITADPTTRKPNLEHWAYLLTYGLPH